MKKRKLFRLKVKGTLYNTSKYIFYKENEKVKTFFRKVDVITKKKQLIKSLRNINRSLPMSQHKTLYMRTMKVK